LNYGDKWLNCKDLRIVSACDSKNNAKIMPKIA